MPPDFPELARTMNRDELRRRYSCGNIVIRRWGRECGIDWSERQKPVPPPEGFPETAPLHTAPELAEMYGRGVGTIRRWARETNTSYRGKRSNYTKHDESEKITLCLTCPYAECLMELGKRCKRIGGKNL